MATLTDRDSSPRRGSGRDSERSAANPQKPLPPHIDPVVRVAAAPVQPITLDVARQRWLLAESVAVPGRQLKIALSASRAGVLPSPVAFGPTRRGG
jgi:hypothetical protein